MLGPWPHTDAASAVRLLGRIDVPAQSNLMHPIGVPCLGAAPRVPQPTE